MQVRAEKIFSGCEAIQELEGPPGAPAAYMIYVRDGDTVLETSGYFDLATRLPSRIGSFFHLYTGATRDWVARMRQHLLGDAWTSTFRRSLLAVEFAMQALTNAAVGPVAHVRGEEELSSWLKANTLLVIKETAEPFEVEKAILDSEPSPFNIDLRRTAPFAQALKRARDQHYPRRRRPCSI